LNKYIQVQDKELKEEHVNKELSIYSEYFSHLRDHKLVENSSGDAERSQ
jgi:hypothetical protein